MPLEQGPTVCCALSVSHEMQVPPSTHPPLSREELNNLPGGHSKYEVELSVNQVAWRRHLWCREVGTVFWADICSSRVPRATCRPPEMRCGQRLGSGWGYRQLSQDPPMRPWSQLCMGFSMPILLGFISF